MSYYTSATIIVQCFAIYIYGIYIVSKYHDTNTSILFHRPSLCLCEKKKVPYADRNVDSKGCGSKYAELGSLF